MLLKNLQVDILRDIHIFRNINNLIEKSSGIYFRDTYNVKMKSSWRYLQGHIKRIGEMLRKISSGRHTCPCKILIGNLQGCINTMQYESPIRNMD